ncbi:MAG TPA: potassium channel family protein, partial [Acidimicrobiales bacterium]
WRKDYKAFVDASGRALDWLPERTLPFHMDTPALRELRERFEHLGTVLRPSAKPMAHARVFFAMIEELASEVGRVGDPRPVVAGWMPRLEDQFRLMVPYALFRPEVMVPVALVPGIGPLLLLWVFPEDARQALQALPTGVFFALLVVALSVNFAIVWQVVERASLLVTAIGPYTPLFAPPALLSVVSIFAMAYWVPASEGSGCMSQALSKLDALYFSVTTFTTTGYGDLLPAESLCRNIATLEMLFTFFLVTIALATYVSRASNR